MIADTDVIIDFFSDTGPQSQVVEDLIRSGRLAITAITMFELYAGVRSVKRLKQVEVFGQAIPVLALDLLAAAHAGKIYTDLKSRGITVGNQDILIAGICLANGLPLLSRNKDHFGPVEGLALF